MLTRLGGPGRLGEGTTVAEPDIGADGTRTALGCCAKPDGSRKVAVVQDPATRDHALNAHRRGTNVVGIELGVAAGTRIAPPDVFDSTGTAESNDINNAINWRIADKATCTIVAVDSISAPAAQPNVVSAARSPRVDPAVGRRIGAPSAR